MLTATEKNTGTRVCAGVVVERSDRQTLADMGLSKDESSRYQKLAAIPAKHFETARQRPRSPPPGMLRKFAQQWLSPKRHQRKQARIEELDWQQLGRQRTSKLYRENSGRAAEMMNPQNMQVAVLAPDRFVAAYSWTNVSAQNVEAVAFGAFNHPSAGVIDCYAKFYPAQGRGMVNEITGWLLAKSFGLPVPEHAFVAFVPIAELPRPLVGMVAQLEAQGIETYPAFCTQNANPISVQPIMDTGPLIDEIRRWSHLHACVAFDEGVANADRHARNLVRNGLRNFVLIDHGRLAWTLGAPEWKAEHLSDPLSAFANRLATICWGDAPADRDSSAVIAACETILPPTAALLSELQLWWNALVTGEDDRRAWATFLSERLEQVDF